MPNLLTETQRFWLAHLDKAEATGKPLTVYARAHKLDVAQLYAYRSKFKRRLSAAAASPFVRAVPAESRPLSGSIRVELRNGVAVVLTGDVDLPSLCAELSKL